MASPMPSMGIGATEITEGVSRSASRSMRNRLDVALAQVAVALNSENRPGIVGRTEGEISPSSGAAILIRTGASGA